MKLLFFDTETCGFHGPTVLIQHAYGDGKIHLHEVFREPISHTLNLIEGFCHETVCGFNLAFDWFHLCQTYTTLSLLGERVGFDTEPQFHINEYAICEERARFGPCLKPKSALDLMLHARKGPYQSTMDRKDITVKRVPTALANPLRGELERRIALDDIYFSRRKKDRFGPRWKVELIERADGKIDTDFRNITLRFAASASLKTLAVAAGLVDEADKFEDVELERRWFPVEYGWAPFALAVSKATRDWKSGNGRAWPGVILRHIDHWAFNEKARQYAYNDVVYTRGLYEHMDCPEAGDNDSVLACMVGAVRWKGFAVNVEGLKQLKKDATERAKRAPTAPARAFQYIKPGLSPTELAVVGKSTAKGVLEKLAQRLQHCTGCGSDQVNFKKTKDFKTAYCENCGSDKVRAPVALLAEDVLEARGAKKEIELYDKLLQAGRFHTDFKVIGALSSRMSGASGLNPQGIKHTGTVRSKFPLADPEFVLCGGDFSGFEISIADADYNDPDLRRELCTCAGCGYVCTPDEFRDDACKNCGEIDSKRKLHGLFAMELNPGLDYDDILATKKSDNDLYDQGKRGVFSQLYGGNFATMVEKLSVSEEVAKRAEQGFAERFKGVQRARERINDDFCSMRQPGGIGKAVEWHEPADYIESMTGFRRYFTLENQICRELFNLANKPPKSWKAIKIKCMRREGRVQTVAGAVMSALYASAFNIQSRNMRAAANHRIQSTGATITKHLQRCIWDKQPEGVNEWIVQPLNIHDEIMCPTKPGHEDELLEVVDYIINYYKETIPLIKIDWSNDLTSWADK